MKKIVAKKINDVDPETVSGKASKVMVQIYSEAKKSGGKQVAVNAIAQLAIEAVGGGNAEINMLIAAFKNLEK